eukprot:scaffold1803_cov63-Phaeocystis_antarctica.AAC.2
MGALELGERRLLLVLGALAVPEGADVGGESRLLLGRVLVVLILLEHGVGLGRVIVHRVAEEEKECWRRRSGEREQGSCMRGSVRGGGCGGGGGAAAGARRSCGLVVERVCAWCATRGATSEPATNCNTPGSNLLEGGRIRATLAIGVQTCWKGDARGSNSLEGGRIRATLAKSGFKLAGRGTHGVQTCWRRDAYVQH